MEVKSTLLDTNTYSLFAKGDKVLVQYIERQKIIFINIISIGELYAGFNRGTKFEDNERVLRSFVSKDRVKVLELAYKTGVIYGKISSYLYKKGKPIPINDVLITTSTI